jgi:WD40 repeat protein
LEKAGAHAKAVTALAFAPDGRTLVSGGGDDAIRLWEISSKECCGVIGDYHTWGLVAVAFSPDGKTIALGCAAR